MARTVDGRLAYANLLRVLATIAAIILLISTNWIGQTTAGTFNWKVLMTYNAMTRWCVPMFAMLSGAFLLDPKKSVRLRDIFLKYILRILIALLVWGTLYALVDYGYVGGRFTWSGVLNALYHVFWADTHHHFWFLYIMLGLYLITPILRAFVRGASRGDLHWFFLITFLFASLLPMFQTFFPGQLALPIAWMKRMDIQLILGYAGYYVAGYYLKNYTLGRISEFIIYLLGVLGCVATLWGTYAMGTSVVLDYHAPNIVLMSIAVFVLFRYVLGISDERSRRQRLVGVAHITFGIYLVHEFFVMLLEYFGISTLSFSPIAAVPVLAAGVFLCSFLVAWLLSKVPLVGRFLT